jgi:hypothetical protein
MTALHGAQDFGVCAAKLLAIFWHCTMTHPLVPETR